MQCPSIVLSYVLNKINGTALDEETLKFSSEQKTWYRPSTLKKLLRIKEENPECHLIVGNTEIGKFFQDHLWFNYVRYNFLYDRSFLTLDGEINLSHTN